MRFATNGNKTFNQQVGSKLVEVRCYPLKKIVHTKHLTLCACDKGKGRHLFSLTFFFLSSILRFVCKFACDFPSSVSVNISTVPHMYFSSAALALNVAVWCDPLTVAYVTYPSTQWRHLNPLGKLE